MKFQINFKMAFVAALSSLLIANTSIGQDSNYRDSIEQSRMVKNEELKSKKTSPLQKADRKKFHELNYFPVDQSWNVRASYHTISNGEVLDFVTSIGAIKKFQKHGYFVFKHEALIDTLYAYKRVYPEGYVSNYPPYLFVPFKDFTSGNETYGGGRYIETAVFEKDQNVMLEFNTCYNPYCAYGDGFSCPIPPEENFVNDRVEAGEKDYGEH